MNTFLIPLVITAVACFFLESFILGFLRLLGFYIIIGEKQAVVYTLFGAVIGVIDEPGIHFLWLRFGWRAPLLCVFGKSYTCEMRLDQEYLRSAPVNSEEGAPMGIGVWYEFFINDPQAHVFKNVDPRGSLRANVGNATVRCLSNMPLTKMMENRHDMSQSVRNEVSPLSQEWGYKLGSVYIRKVHFRDPGMIRQIEEKVVNRLRQVTSAIRQDGTNQVNIITSTAEKEAASEFARAVAIRSQIVGDALQTISRDKQVTETLFELLEIQNILDSKADITLIPKGSDGNLLTQLLASSSPSPKPSK